MEDIEILPRGYRFHPLDEEVIYHLILKAMDPSYSTPVILEVNLNKFEPWFLMGLIKVGEKEIYLFAQQGKKYPKGPRIDRSTENGFWKITGKDKEIYGDGKIIGKKKTLVFYMGRASGGVKTNWVMNEFRMEGSPSTNPPALNEWVVARISYNGVMDGSERRNPLEKEVVPESAIMLDTDYPITGLINETHFTSGVKENFVLGFTGSFNSGFTGSSLFEVGSTSNSSAYDNLKITEMTRDLPAPNDESEFNMDGGWLIVPENEEKDKEKNKKKGISYDQNGNVWEY